MIEINYRNEVWEAYIYGALFEYDPSLAGLLELLASQSARIEEEINE